MRRRSVVTEQDSSRIVLDSVAGHDRVIGAAKMNRLATVEALAGLEGRYAGARGTGRRKGESRVAAHQDIAGNGDTGSIGHQNALKLGVQAR